MSSRRRVTLHGASTIIEANKQLKGSVFERLGGEEPRSTRKVQRTSSGGLTNRRFSGKRSQDVSDSAEPCRMWLKTGDCPYGDNCKNSHGDRRRAAERNIEEDDADVRGEYRVEASKSFVVTSQQHVRHQRTIMTSEQSPSRVAQKRRREASPSPQPARKRWREEMDNSERRQSQQMSSAVVVQSRSDRKAGEASERRTADERRTTDNRRPVDERRTPKKRNSREDAGRSSAPSSSTKIHASERKPHHTEHNHEHSHAVRSAERKPSGRSERMYHDSHQQLKSEGLSQHGSLNVPRTSRGDSRSYHEPLQVSHHHLPPSEWELRHRPPERAPYHSHSPSSRSSRHSSQWHDPHYIAEGEYRRSNRSSHHYSRIEMVSRSRDTLISPPHDRHSYPYRHDRSLRSTDWESERHRPSHRSSAHSRVDSRSSHLPTPSSSSSSHHSHHHHRHEKQLPDHRREGERVHRDHRHAETRQRSYPHSSPGKKEKQQAPPKAPLDDTEIFSPAEGHDSHSSDDDSASPIRSPIHSSPSHSPSSPRETDNDDHEEPEEKAEEDEVDEEEEEVEGSEEDEGSGGTGESSLVASDNEQSGSSDEEESASGSPSDQVDSASENDSSVRFSDPDVPASEFYNDGSLYHRPAFMADNTKSSAGEVSESEQQEDQAATDAVEEEEETMEVTTEGNVEKADDRLNGEMDVGKGSTADNYLAGKELNGSAASGSEHTPSVVSSKEGGKKVKGKGSSRKLKPAADSKKRRYSRSPAPEPMPKKEAPMELKSSLSEKKVEDQVQPMNDIFDEFSPGGSPFPNDTVADDYETSETAAAVPLSRSDAARETESAIDLVEGQAKQEEDQPKAKVDKEVAKELQVGLSDGDLYEGWSDDEQSLALLRRPEQLPAPVQGSNGQRGLGSLYEDMDTFSDDELDAILHNEGSDHVEMEDDLVGELATGARSVEEVDWSVLAVPKRPAEVSTGECLERFTTERIFRSIGLSTSLAGSELTERVQEICALDETERKSEVCSNAAQGLGAVIASKWGAPASRKALLSPGRGALTAREDLSLRRHLHSLSMKMKGLVGQQPSVVVSTDHDLLRISLAVYCRTAQGVGAEAAAKVHLAPSAVGDVLSIIA